MTSDARKELVERVATVCGGNYIAAAAAIDIALEEAARVCDACPDSHWGPAMAAAIRALKGKPDE